MLHKPRTGKNTRHHTRNTHVLHRFTLTHPYFHQHQKTPQNKPESPNKPPYKPGIKKQHTKTQKKHRITHNTNRTETTRKKPPNSKKPTEQQTSPAGKKYVNEKKVYGGKPCAYAHVRITLVRSENNFFSKKSFSPEENFSQKILLYCL